MLITNINDHPGLCGSVGWASSQNCRFDYWSVHMPDYGLDPSRCGGRRQLIRVSLSPSSFLSLKKIKKKKFFFKKAMITISTLQFYNNF